MVGMNATRRKPGPRPKGVREQICARLPADHLAHYRQVAEDLGMPVGDYIALKMAEVHGWPAPEYINRDKKQQEALPLSA